MRGIGAKIISVSLRIMSVILRANMAIRLIIKAITRVTIIIRSRLRARMSLKRRLLNY